MKILLSSLLILFSSCATGKNSVYIGSTPAGKVVKSFLGIPLTDSIDFIRWKITLQEDKYMLTCNYGIGKPNTNGFIDGGKWIARSGLVTKEKDYYFLHNNGKSLGLLEVNTNLLHIADERKKLLVGNGGWSYSLTSEKPFLSREANIVVEPFVLKDSMAFEGRTPCFESSVIQKTADCYKLKWWIILYGDIKNNKPTRYFLNGTIVDHKARTGTWSVIHHKDGRAIYQLKWNDTEALYLLKLDENIFVFTDKAGNLLAGNADFSFTLNKKW
jgi:hypothetical protein